MLLSLVFLLCIPLETESDELKPWVPGKVCPSKEKNVREKSHGKYIESPWLLAAFIYSDQSNQEAYIL